MANKTNNTEQADARAKFSKYKILGMKRYMKRVDLLSALLKPELTYTLEEVNSLIDDFMKGGVK